MKHDYSEGYTANQVDTCIFGGSPLKYKINIIGP